MRPQPDVPPVMRLAKAGCGASEIARRTGIPRSTIRDWLAKPPSRLAPEVDQLQPPPDTYAYVLGLYLGDGFLASHPRHVWRMRITLDRRYPGIITECGQALQQLLPDNRVLVSDRKDGCSEVGVYSKRLPTLFPQHGRGPKHGRKIALLQWQEEICRRHPEPLLRGLIHSDGCRYPSVIHRPRRTYRYVNYQFSNRSDDIRAIFCAACDRIDVPWRQTNRCTITVATRAAVARLDAFIGPKR